MGTAEPPHGMARSDEVSRPFSSGSTPMKMVGTPAGTVTRSSTMRSASALGERSGPGMISVAPVATPAWARPQALAWNIGTTGSTRSDSRMPMLSAPVAAKVCSQLERWL